MVNWREAPAVFYGQCHVGWGRGGAVLEKYSYALNVNLEILVYWNKNMDVYVETFNFINSILTNYIKLSKYTDIIKAINVLTGWW